MTTDYPRTCHLCGDRAHPSRLLKYGTRNYAHFSCFAARKTLADIEKLPGWPRKQFEEWLNEQHPQKGR